MRFGSRLPSLAAVALLIVGVVALLVTWDGGSTDGDGREQARARAEARVVAITDGDTIRVEIGGREERVRYIGIDTPESVIPGERPECFGKRAADFNGGLLGGGRVTLVFGAERRDHYGRLLAYVYADGAFVNARLVRAGFARTLEIAPNTDFAARFARLQQLAANAGRGLWSAC